MRLNELRQLVWDDIHLEHERPHIRARASTTKNRKEALLPIHPRLVEALSGEKPSDAKPEKAVFKIIKQPDWQFRRDLKLAGIEQVDALGRKVDFHALRYTFATKLAKEGVAQRLAQELMRHSDPKLTAMIYTDPSQLPTFESVQRLTWHDDQPEKVSTQIGTQNPDFSGHSQSQADTFECEISNSEALDHQSISLDQKQPDNNCQMVLRAGLEPSTPNPQVVDNQKTLSKHPTPLTQMRTQEIGTIRNGLSIGGRIYLSR